MRNDLPFPCHKPKGSALIVILIILGLAAALLVSALKSNPQVERDKITADALAKAKDALIGYAITYRDKGHPDDVFGYLPCPDFDNDGEAEANQTPTQCAGKDIPVAGRLPWKTLGLPPLRDSHGECLWYAVSGTFKAVAGGNLTDFMNWDTLGQFAIQDAGGSTVSGATAHSRPVAVIFSPGPPLSAQNRPPSSGQECSGDTTNSVAAYLDGGNAFAVPTPPPVMLTAGAYGNTTINDRLLWITPTEIFDRIKRRSDFAADINDLLSNTPISPGSSITLAAYLNSLTPASLPTLTSGTKGSDDVYDKCKTADPANCWNKLTARQQKFLANWHDNLLYTKLATPTKITVNGALTANVCNAVLLFGGERTTRTVAPLVAQTRATSNEKNDAAMYLEGANATSFPSGTSFSGISTFSKTGTAQDLIACIGAGSAGSTGGGGIYTGIVPPGVNQPAGWTGDTGQSSVTLSDGTIIAVTSTSGSTPTIYVSNTGIGIDSGSGAKSLNLGNGEQMSFTFTSGQQSLAVLVGMLKNNDSGSITFKNDGATVGTATIDGCSSSNTSIFNNVVPAGNPTFNQVIFTAGTNDGYYINQVVACAAGTCAITGEGAMGADTCTSWTSP